MNYEGETEGGRWEVRVSDERMFDDPEETKVQARFDDEMSAYSAAMKISRMRDLAFGVWDSECGEFVEVAP